MSILGIGLGALGAVAQSAMNNSTMNAQLGNQMKLNEQAARLARENWDYTNFGNQVKHMKNAGLNIGLMYGGGGQGGQSGTGSGGSAGMAQAPDVMGIMQSQANLELIKAQTEKAKAEAKNIGEKTTTEVNSRDVMIENMRQSGIAQWFENMKTEMMRNGVSENEMEVEMFRNAVYGKSAGGYDSNSPEVKKFNADLAKTVAEQKNLDASALLTNEKALGYWQELLIATKNADANMINAKANELAKEWETGEFTNWRTWVEIAKDATGVATDLIKAGKTPKALPKR